MKTNKSRLIVFALIAAVLLSSCTVNLCVKPFGYDPHPPPHESLVCRRVYGDGSKPIYNIRTDRIIKP